ncbi:Hypothetical predicted protein [Octopus vulgaris]|uniref:Uncharacterized protein n=1 Tax=Octopus vulgaris TaxID=6645 RepID=A0AA36ANF2_OCTVU|nr:Hypothetical predicted protein [Octopus vulgaris]
MAEKVVVVTGYDIVDFYGEDDHHDGRCVSGGFDSAGVGSAGAGTGVIIFGQFIIGLVAALILHNKRTGFHHWAY